MIVQQKHEGSKGSFFITENEETLAQMTYTMPSATLMIIDHTEVDDKLRGKSAGVQMVDTAVEYARANSIKIIPLCPFAHSVFVKRAATYDDVWKQ
jgi:uncharacterized protein